MRKIKFRAWDKKGKEMLYSSIDNGFLSWGTDFNFTNSGEVEVTVWGNVAHKQVEKCYFMWGVTKKLTISTKHIMQFTNLKDREERDIYEGDIIIHHEDYKKGMKKVEGDRWYILEWEDGITGYKPFNDWENGFSANDCIILGNIYENSNLLKE